MNEELVKQKQVDVLERSVDVLSRSMDSLRETVTMYRLTADAYARNLGDVNQRMDTLMRMEKKVDGWSRSVSQAHADIQEIQDQVEALKAQQPVGFWARLRWLLGADHGH